MLLILDGRFTFTIRVPILQIFEPEFITELVPAFQAQVAFDSTLNLPRMRHGVLFTPLTPDRNLLSIVHNRSLATARKERGLVVTDLRSGQDLIVVPKCLPLQPGRILVFLRVVVGVLLRPKP